LVLKKKARFKVYGESRKILSEKRIDYCHEARKVNWNQRSGNGFVLFIRKLS